MLFDNENTKKHLQHSKKTLFNASKHSAQISGTQIMTEKTISVTEQELHNIVKRCVYRTLQEYEASESQCTIQQLWDYEKKLQERYGTGLCRLQKMFSYQRHLYEGLIHSFDINVLKDRLEQLGVQILKVDTSNETPRIYAKIATEERQQVLQLLSQCGWYDIQPNEPINLIVPKFGKDAQDIVYSTHKGILYHTTPLNNCDRISSQGLVPQSGNKIDNSQDLVHFLFSPNECETLACSLSMTARNHPLEFTLYRIDLNKIQRDTIKPKFFFDPQYPKSVVTLDNLPPYCLTRIKDFEIQI